MARTKKEEEIVEEVAVAQEKEISTVEEAPASSKKYALNNFNFTAVGEHFLSLCDPEITIESTNTALIKVAEEQVKLGILKIVK